MFRSDYPRGIVIRLRLWWFAAFDALSIPPTLISPLRFADCVARYLCCAFHFDHFRAAFRHSALQ